MNSDCLSVYSGDMKTIYWDQRVSDITDISPEGELGEWFALAIRTGSDSYALLLGLGLAL